MPYLPTCLRLASSALATAPGEQHQLSSLDRAIGHRVSLTREGREAEPAEAMLPPTQSGWTPASMQAPSSGLRLSNRSITPSNLNETGEGPLWISPEHLTPTLSCGARTQPRLR